MLKASHSRNNPCWVSHAYLLVSSRSSVYWSTTDTFHQSDRGITQTSKTQRTTRLLWSVVQRLMGRRHHSRGSETWRRAVLQSSTVVFTWQGWVHKTSINSNWAPKSCERITDMPLSKPDTWMEWNFPTFQHSTSGLLSAGAELYCQQTSAA